MLYHGGKFITGKFSKRLVILKNRFGSWKEIANLTEHQYQHILYLLESSLQAGTSHCGGLANQLKCKAGMTPR